MNSKNILRTLAMLFSLSALVFITSCDSDNGDEPEPEPEPTETLLQILSGNPDYSDLVNFYTLNAAVLPSLDGTTEWTVFAPNNNAFNVLRATLDTDDLTTVAPEIIAGVLAFHFVEGTVREADFGTALTTRQGEQITWNTDNTIQTGGSNTMVNVVEGKGDQLATNGVVHEVDAILIPPTIFQAIGLNLGTVAQPVLLGADFSDLRQIIAVADSDVPAGEMSIAAMLADQSGAGYTAFLPVNDVLTGVAQVAGISKEALIASVTTAQGDFTAAQIARGFLKNHIYKSEDASGVLTAAAVLATVDATTGVGATITMLSGKELTVRVVPASADTPAGCTNGGDSCIFLAGDVTDSDTYVPIFATDAFDFNGVGSASNGALHVSSIIQ